MSSNSDDDDDRYGTEHRAADTPRANLAGAQLSKRELLATVGHELRTPLHAVTGMLDLLWNTALDAEQRSYLADARHNTAALVRIVGDALDYATLAAGEMSLDPEPTSIRAIVDAAASAHAQMADARGLELIVDVDQGIPEHVLIDSSRVQQVLSHLIETAVFVTADGHVLVQVYLNPIEGEATLDADPDATHLLSINVLDSPSGEASPPRLAADVDGDSEPAAASVASGLSLALCIELVNRMNGRLDVYQQPGGGSCATCLVPAILPDDDAALAAAHSATPTTATERIIDQPHGFELVVYDPHPCTRQALGSMARFLGVDVVTADDPNDLLDIVSLPTLGVQRALLLGSGHALAGTRRALQQIRALRGAGDMPVAVAAPPSLAAGAKATLDVPVTLDKPVSFAALRTAISTLSRNVTARQNPGVATSYEKATLTGHVLVVDDVSNNLKIAGSMLRRMGMSVTTCSSGAEALDAIACDTFDLIFMDIQMPGMDGHETTRAIRRLDNVNACTPIVALTANYASESLRTARESGMDDFVAKPARAIRLREVVSRWLRAADALNEYPADVPDLLEQDAATFGALIRQQRELEALVHEEAYEDVAARAAQLQSSAQAARARTLARLAHLTAEACRLADFESAERYIGVMRRLEQPHDCAAACG